ncbi:MAG: hypothetical protein ABIP34_06740 [Rhodoferax sp.]|uniref:hypothetical protein n=1 Tax=Rhodoferax sp. TaxID=50421 RepID=UPI003265517D
MKHFFWLLLKLNVVGIALLTFFGFLIGNSGRDPGAAVFVPFLGCIVYLAYLNIRTVYRARQDIAASIQNGAVDVAASAIEFRNAAHARVNERIKERKQHQDSNES